jgi:integrase/recombinase XerD
MLDRFFYRQDTLKRVRSNPLGQRLDDFAVYLVEHEYSPGTIRLYLTAAAHFGTWLGRNRIFPESITESTVNAFLHRHLPECRCRSPYAICGKEVPAALHHFVLMLCQGGHLRPTPPPLLTPLDQEVAHFETHLRMTCGLAENTIVYRVRYAREFLAATFPANPPEISSLTANQVADFIYDQARRFKPASIKVLASSLRSFLRFSFLQGKCPRELSCAVPTVAVWKKSGIPKTISPAQLETFLSIFDRSTAIGRRDYAMCLCLAQLGLRRSEVAHLTLDNLDWKGGTICIASGKTPRSRCLPLPKKLGRAIVNYLRQGRPQSSVREIFLRHTPPKGKPITPGIVAHVVARGCSRITPKLSISPHAFRHTAASTMYTRGATFKEIADVLGHQEIDTVSIYAKVNWVQLRRVAMPWI